MGSEMQEQSADLSDLADLPGVRGQLRSVAADLAAGLNCLWLLPDRLVESGQADELYRGALFSASRRVDVPPPDRDGAKVQAVHESNAAGDSEAVHEGWADAEALPFLDFYDDGFDLGWEPQGHAPVIPAPRTETAGRNAEARDLLARIAKELSVTAEEVVGCLTDPERGGRRPVVGVRAWKEPNTASLRGAGIEQLYRSLTAAVKAAGLPPGQRPRLLVAARLGDVSAALPDELHLDLSATAVHWWWGALGRLDTATAITPYLDRGGAPRHERDLLRERIVRELRAETVVEICGPDLELARRLAVAWDGTQQALGTALRRCLAAGPSFAADCSPPPAQLGSRRRPGSEFREAWASGAITAWEGRLRLHPGVWLRADAIAEWSVDAKARLSTLISQAQQRVLLPWIEEARQRLAARALSHLTRPVAAVVATYLERPIWYLGDRPELAFLELQVGELLRAHIQGALALPERDARLLRLLVQARNVLSHRAVLYDTTLAELCVELSRADLRTT
ncbi:hypothetical protein [Streptomyces sp. NBC_01481]|uniref:hypothetical protein n=1 Tax=Streptomyces sp. NBC_01481 TaxID=2975869 RepID=UPI002255938F|nr:hypothetical protein [Streptomyces sp. NBC_01481]MCX4583077.1 hypothetical protein [Streptomyces sp. NBC_01481]